jgi:hypothetical protein
VISIQRTASLDRFFTLLFLVVSIVLSPLVYRLFDASERIEGGGLLRGYLLSSISVVIIVVVTVYGFAVLLNVQWLRLAGLYGLFCIYFKTGLILSCFLSTSPENWGNLAVPLFNYVANLVPLMLAPITFYVWQKRNRTEIIRSTYYIGIIVSYDLFLLFTYLLNRIMFVSAEGDIALHGVVFPVLGTIGLWLFWLMREKLSTNRGIVYLFGVFFIWYKVWASLLLSFPLIIELGVDAWVWIVNIQLASGILVIISLIITALFALWKRYIKTR